MQEDLDLMSAFNLKFKQALTDMAVVKRLLGTPSVRKWYADYKVEKAAEKSIPAQFLDVGMTADQWNKAQADLRARRLIRKAESEEIAAAAAVFERALKAASMKAATLQEPHFSPMVQVIELGYNDLTLTQQINVETGPADQREARLQAAIKVARRAVVNGAHHP
jgi:hypothetical protein